MDNSQKKRILLVDDEPDILEFIGYNLKNEGYEVHTAINGKEAIKKAIEIKPLLIILDVMMPEMDGIETCNHIREINELNDTIIAFLTARGEDYSQIAGFEAGGDDYITKPIKPKVLVSRVKALLKRHAKSNSTPIDEESHLIKIGNIIIDKEKYLVLNMDEEVILPRKEFELLSLLVSKQNKVFTRDEIYNVIWGDIIVGDRTIDVHIRKLREKLGNDIIKTIKGVGYKFVV
ncbi:MAG: response regulator transcription factor [Bacteroidales bacterium]|nr:response regulator transcription factor [Bacteroidales bacterium]